jgi:hypothetical protein
MPPARLSLVGPLLQYLSLLLAAPDAAVVLATLQTLAAFVRKSGSPTTRRVTCLHPLPAQGSTQRQRHRWNDRFLHMCGVFSGLRLRLHMPCFHGS